MAILSIVTALGISLAVPVHNMPCYPLKVLVKALFDAGEMPQGEPLVGFGGTYQLWKGPNSWTMVVQPGPDIACISSVGSKSEVKGQDS